MSDASKTMWSNGNGSAMNNTDSQPEEAADLRKWAEKIVREKEVRWRENSEPFSPEELQKTLHELRVHQIELELQNEELRRAQAELDGSRARYFDLYDMAPVGYLTVSITGLILEGNFAAAKMFGVVRGALANYPFSRFIPEEDQGIYYYHRKQLFAAGVPQAYEQRMVAVDGTIFWAHLTATALGGVATSAGRSGDGVRLSRIVLSDITERKQAEQRLCDERNLLSAIINAIPDEVAVKDLERRFVLVNPPCIRALGKESAEEVLGKRDEDLILKEFADINILEEEQALSTGRPLLNIERESHPDPLTGEVRRATLTSRSPILDENGTIVGLVVVNRDITERKRAESQRLEALGALRKSEANLAEAQGIAHTGSWEWDMIGNTVRWSKEMYRVFDIDPETYDGKPESLLRMIHPDDAELFASTMKINRSNGMSPSLEYRIIHRDGSVHNILAEGKVEFDGAGKPLRSVGTVQDITERKRMENQRRQIIEEKNVLLREVHHRVKNNLTVISSLLNIQSSAIRTPEEAIVAFRNSRDRIMAMALVHNELYESSDHARVDMSRYLARLIRQLSMVYGTDRNINIHVQAGVTFLGVDRAIPCGLILNELITNAYKHAFPDGRAGEIRILLQRADDEVFELSSSDNGIGLPPGYESRETLGLSLVRLLTEQLDGTMDIVIGNGTCCVIRFPHEVGL